MVATTTSPHKCMVVDASVVRPLVKEVHSVETSNWTLAQTFTSIIKAMKIMRIFLLPHNHHCDHQHQQPDLVQKRNRNALSTLKSRDKPLARLVA